MKLALTGNGLLPQAGSSVVANLTPLEEEVREVVREFAPKRPTIEAKSDRVQALGLFTKVDGVAVSLTLGHNGWLEWTAQQSQQLLAAADAFVSAVREQLPEGAEVTLQVTKEADK